MQAEKGTPLIACLLLVVPLRRFLPEARPTFQRPAGSPSMSRFIACVVSQPEQSVAIALHRFAADRQLCGVAGDCRGGSGWPWELDLECDTRQRNVQLPLIFTYFSDTIRSNAIAVNPPAAGAVAMALSASTRKGRSRGLGQGTDVSWSSD